MAEIKIIDNGPLVATDVTVLDGEGKQMDVGDEVHLCRCGLSGNIPFCDGSHRGQFESAVRS